MTPPEDEYGDRLRRALHAAADGVVPSGDGLERIRQKVADERSRGGFEFLLAWLRSALSDFRSLLGELRAALPVSAHGTPARVLGGMPRLTAAVAAAKSALVELSAALWTAARTAFRRTVPVAHATARTVRMKVPGRLRGREGWLRGREGWLRGREGWLRPVLATGGAVLVAILAILAIPGLRENIMPSSSNVTSTPKPGSSGPGGLQGTGSQPPGTSATAAQRSSPSPSPKRSARHKRGSTAPVRCAASLASPATCSPSAPPPTTPPPASPSPTPTVSSSSPSTSSPTPSPTPTDSSTPGISSSGPGSGTASSAGATSSG